MLLLILSGGLCHLAYGCAPWRLVIGPNATARSDTPTTARSMDTTQKVNLYLGVVLYAVVIVTCTVTFLQDKATADVLASIQVRELKRAAFAARAHSLPMLYPRA